MGIRQDMADGVGSLAQLWHIGFQLAVGHLLVSRRLHLVEHTQLPWLVLAGNIMEDDAGSEWEDAVHVQGMGVRKPLATLDEVDGAHADKVPAHSCTLTKSGTAAVMGLTSETNSSSSSSSSSCSAPKTLPEMSIFSKRCLTLAAASQRPPHLASTPCASQL